MNEPVITIREKIYVIKEKLLAMIIWMKNIHPDQYESMRKEIEKL